MASRAASGVDEVPVRGMEAGGVTAGVGKDVALEGRRLGEHQLEIDGKLVLLPHPSDDPNDPLRWSQPFKVYVAVIVCLAALMSNFLAAGPTVAIVSIGQSFTSPLDIQKTSYLFSTTALFQGASNFVWIPLINKYGRRVCYIAATSGYLLCVLWSVLSTAYASELVGRMMLGFFSGGAECIGPIVITDIFFLHERGRYLMFYNTFLSFGVDLGIIIDGLIVLNLDWHYIYWVAFAIVGSLLVLITFTFPETAFRRVFNDAALTGDANSTEASEKAGGGGAQLEHGGEGPPPRKSYLQRMSLYHGTFTQEPLLRMFFRPFGMILLPAVAYAAWIFAVTIGFLVAITSNFAVALGSPPYNFTATQSGLCFIGGAIGTIVGIPFGGHAGDWLAGRRTRANGGFYKPEYRLPMIIPPAVAGILALILYGVGIQHQLPWIVPVIGLGLLSLAIVAGTNIAMVYALDVYKPVAGEVVVAILAFKAVFGFALSFGTNAWIALEGYQSAFGEMAAISAFFFLTTLVFHFFGGSIRQASVHWKLTQWIAWDADRDDPDPATH